MPIALGPRRPQGVLPKLAVTLEPHHIPPSPAVEQAQHARTWGLYAQDQWRVNRLTMNLGLRWDYTKVGYPDQTRPTNIYFTEPLAVEGDTVVSWKDLQPGRRIRPVRQREDGRQVLRESVRQA